MDTKTIKTIKLTDNSEVTINAVKLEGLTADELKKSVTTDDIQSGDIVWVFNCGSSTEVID